MTAGSSASFCWRRYASGLAAVWPNELLFLGWWHADDVKTCYPCLILPKAGRVEDSLALADACHYHFT